MPYYHVTFDRHLPSIQASGLAANPPEQNWEGIEPGVYLTSDPAIGLLMLIEYYVGHGPDDSRPADYVNSLRVIVIDDGRIDRSRLLHDPQIPTVDGVWLYPASVDVHAMPILTVDQIREYLESR